MSLKKYTVASNGHDDVAQECNDMNVQNVIGPAGAFQYPNCNMVHWIIPQLDQLNKILDLIDLMVQSGTTRMHRRLKSAKDWISNLTEAYRLQIVVCAPMALVIL